MTRLVSISIKFVLTGALLLGMHAPAAGRPDILFIAVDDLNDWISPLGGHPQAITPNFDRLAAQSVLFTNAHGSMAKPTGVRSTVATRNSAETTR